MAEQDMLSQIRALNPDLKDYDDTTLAATIADQHPDYKPYLTKYLHPASADLAAQAASPKQEAQEFAQQQPMSLKEALTTPSKPLMKAASGVQNPVLRGAAEFGTAMMTPANAALAAAIPAGAVGQAAGGAFGSMAALDTVKAIPRLVQLYQSGDHDKFAEEATKAGLGALVAGMGLVHAAHAVRSVPDVTAQAAAAATEKAAPVAEEAGPETAEAAKTAAEAQQSVAEKQLVPEEPEETEGPPIVKTSSGPVKPNPPAIDEVRDELKQSLRDRGANPDDPQAQADLYQKFYGISKPVNVTSVGDVPVSESSVTPDDYQMKLADNDPSKVAHEIQHVRMEEGQIPSVPEGPGANDQISGQVAQDLTGGGKWAPRPTPNLNRLAIPGEAKAAIAEYADQITRSGPVSLEQTAADAAALGLSLKDVKNLPEETRDLGAKWTAARQLEGGAVINYKAVAQAALANPSDMAAKIAKDHATVAMVELMTAATETGANFSRALGSGRINAEGMDPTVAGMRDLVRQLRAKGPITEDTMEMLRNSDLSNALVRQRIRTYMAAQQPAQPLSAWQQLGKFFLSDILSGFPTSGIKIFADETMLNLSPATETLGALAKGRFATAFDEGAMRQAGIDAARHDALAAFSQAFKQGDPIITGHTPVADTASSIFKGLKGAEGPIPGLKYVTPPSLRTLGGINAAYHMMNERGYLYAEGARQAYADGIPREKWPDYAKAFADNPTPDALIAATADAQKNTATAPPGPILQSALGVRKAVPGMKLEIPTAMVPANIVKTGFDLSPFGGMKVLADTLMGKPVTTQAAGRAVLGSMVWAWALQQAASGRLHGSGPSDYAQNQALKKAGWIPDSYTMPNGEQLPVRAFGALGFSLMTAADLADVIREAPRAPGTQQAINAAATHLYRSVMDYPMLRGLHDLFGAENPAKVVQFMAGNIASGFVPYSSMLARTAAAMDTDQRRVADAVDVVKSRIPFVRESLSPKFTLTGQPLPAPGSAASRLAWPGSPVEVSDSPTERMAAGFGLGGSNPTTVSLGSGITLKLDQNDAPRLEQLAGQNIKKVFDRLDRAPSQLESMPPTAQQTLLKNVITQGRAAARDQLLGEMAKDGRLKAYMAQAGIASANKAQLNPYAVDLAVPGADKAEDMLNRFGIANSGSPANIPPDLAGQYQRELQVARSQLFQPYYANPDGIGSLPFERGRAIIQKLDDASRALAAKNTLARANLKSKAAASAAQ